MTSLACAARSVRLTLVSLYAPIQVMFKFNSPTPAGSRIPLMKKDKVVIMTDYAPKIFNNIRFVEPHTLPASLFPSCLLYLVRDAGASVIY
jgi:hypothetical protein